MTSHNDEIEHTIRLSNVVAIQILIQKNMNISMWPPLCLAGCFSPIMGNVHFWGNVFTNPQDVINVDGNMGFGNASATTQFIINELGSL